MRGFVLPILLSLTLLGGCYPTHTLHSTAVEGISAQALFERGPLGFGATRSGGQVNLSGAVPAGDLLCGDHLDPPCISASDLTEVEVGTPYRMSAGDWALQSPAIALGVVLSPFYLLPTPRQPGWLEDPSHPCVTTGEVAVARGKAAEAAADRALMARYRELAGYCLMSVAYPPREDGLDRRLWFMAMARVRFERSACVDPPDGSPSTAWILPRSNRMADAGAANWPEELRTILTDPVTWNYPGLAKVCATRGGVRSDLTEAMAYARQGWPLPSPL